MSSLGLSFDHKAEFFWIGLGNEGHVLGHMDLA